MAPTIMVHGINSDYAWFNNGFSQAFQDLDLPFALLDFKEGNGAIASVASNISSLIWQAAQQFGVHHIHIVAHSKGGLWIREFLTKQLPDPGRQSQYPLGVFSVHTLDTPHHGSVAADIAVAAHSGAQVGALFDLHCQYLCGLLAWWQYKPTENSLTVEYVNNYNSNHPNALPRTTLVLGKTNVVQYFAYQGDANLGGAVALNGLGIIDCAKDPCDGFPSAGSLLPKLLYEVMQRWRQVKVTKVLGFIPSYIADPNNPRYYPGNDFVVTVPSAKYEEDKFQTMNTLFVNHTTVGYYAIGSQVAVHLMQGLQIYQ